MKQKPILFSTAMVQAILEGRKTQTRRVVKHQVSWESSCLPKGSLAGFAVYDKRGAQYWLDGEDQPATLADGFCPYGNPGDVLWVRESWFNDADKGEAPIYVYKATFRDFPRGSSKWKPSIHMPYSACRLFLRITDIRVERLQDISEEDCLKEGIESVKVSEAAYHSGTYGEWFRELWQSINGPESWEANPWVWVVSFERTEKPTNQ